MKKTNVFMLTAIFAGAFMLLSFMIPQEQKTPAPWEVPAEYQKKTNPYDEYTKTMERTGKMLWSKHCKSCHGNNGEGDGPKARQLETHAGDFTTEDFQSQSDGAIYYKSFVGREEMPNYEKKIPDEEERWALIYYMRAMKK